MSEDLFLKVPLRRKESAVDLVECKIDHVVMLPGTQFENFSVNMLEDYDFIRDHADHMYGDPAGFTRCLLVLGESSDDGILVDSEGTNYARYSAYIPHGKTLATMAGLEFEVPSRTLTQEQVEIICAEHVLWVYDAGGKQANFTNCKLEGLDLSRKNLNGAILSNAVFRNTDFRDSSFCSAVSDNTNYSSCNFNRAFAKDASFKNSVFESCSLDEAILTHTDLSGTKFPNSTMLGASLRNCYIALTEFSEGNPDNADLQGSTDSPGEWFATMNEINHGCLC